MRKRYIIFLMIISFFTVTGIEASSFSSHLPGGKNYLEANNFLRNQNTLSSIDDILVKSNTTYTLSFVGEGLLEFPQIRLTTNNNGLYDGFAEDYSSCSVGMDYTECTFTTDSNDQYISLEITVEGLPTYYNYYGMEDFQLEEGSARTTYEEYIVPFIDANSPEFSGTGAYITSYDNDYTITEIINNHIVVMDDVDGEITDQVEVISDNYTANKNTVGEYIVELKASDNANNSAYFTLTVIVKDEVNPVITGPTTISVNFDTTLTTQELINDNFTASDGHDGSLILLVQNDQYTINKSTLGSYDVQLTTKDSSNNTTTRTITFLVVDQNAPTLVSETTINVYQSNMKSLQEIVDSLVFSDDYNLNSEIDVVVITETYSASSNNPGSYTMLVQAKDQSNNSSLYTLNITVIDDVSPIIGGPSSFVFSYTELKTLEEMIALQTVSDNQSTLTMSDLVMTSESYTTRTTKVGTFFIYIEIQDESGNKTQKQIQIDVIDDQVPIIYVDNVMITLSENVTFTPQDALNLLVKNRELPDKSYDISVIKDEYTGNEDTPGTYNYSLRFDDEEGNSLQKDFIIEVPDEESVLQDEVLVRNIAVYSISIVILVFALLKRKK